LENIQQNRERVTKMSDDILDILDSKIKVYRKLVEKPKPKMQEEEESE
jgi:hypothetical protein